MKRIAYVLMSSALLVLQMGYGKAQETPTAPPPPVDAARVDIVNAYLSAAKTNLFIGEPVTVQIVVEAPPTAEIVQFPQFPADHDVFEVRSTTPVEQQTDAEQITYTQTIELVLWDLGEHLTPEFPVVYQLPGQSPASAPVRSAYFTVTSSRTDPADEAMRPYRPPVDLFYIPVWVVAPVILVLSLLTWGVYRWVRPGVRKLARAARGTPASVAIAELRDLEQGELAASDVYPLVADTLRRFVQMQFDIRTAERTTAEISQILREQTKLPRTMRRQLRRFLEQADLVKFARIAPQEDSTRRFIAAAVKWIKYAEKIDRESRHP